MLLHQRYGHFFLQMVNAFHINTFCQRQVGPVSTVMDSMQRYCMLIIEVNKRPIVARIPQVWIGVHACTCRQATTMKPLNS